MQFEQAAVVAVVGTEQWAVALPITRFKYYFISVIVSTFVSSVFALFYSVSLSQPMLFFPFFPSSPHSSGEEVGREWVSDLVVISCHLGLNNYSHSKLAWYSCSEIELTELSMSYSKKLCAVCALLYNTKVSRSPRHPLFGLIQFWCHPDCTKILPSWKLMSITIKKPSDAGDLPIRNSSEYFPQSEFSTDVFSFK